MTAETREAVVEKPFDVKAKSAWHKLGFVDWGHWIVCAAFSAIAVTSFTAFCAWGWLIRSESEPTSTLSLWVLERAPRSQAPVIAAFFALIWAVGAPLWFMVERFFWGDRVKDLDKGQDHIRDFWLGLGAIVLVMSDHIIFKS